MHTLRHFTKREVLAADNLFPIESIIEKQFYLRRATTLHKQFGASISPESHLPTPFFFFSSERHTERYF